MSASDKLPAGEPLGFPQCQKCPYVRVGPAWICTECASKALEQIVRKACPICSQMLADDGSCPNWLCDDAGRQIERIDAIAYLSGELRAKIHRYKYEGKTGWSLVFGRLLLGWLEAHAAEYRPDLIVANPTYLAPGAAGPGHVEMILRSVAKEDVLGTWPFDLADPAAIVKTGPTEKSAGRTAAAKRRSGQELRALLRIPDPQRTTGLDILVFDDVCTTGSQLDAVAACLLDEGGAARVRGLVLARAPWRPR
jgi:predicted amidophosphoribosyltransferase